MFSRTPLVLLGESYYFTKACTAAFCWGVEDGPRVSGTGCLAASRPSEGVVDEHEQNRGPAECRQPAEPEIVRRNELGEKRRDNQRTRWLRHVDT